MNTVVLCLGSNLGFRVFQLEQAKTFIQQKVGTILKTSAYYETAPWGSSSQHHHINQCIQIETTHSATRLLKCLLDIEKQLGRERGEEKNTDRLLDIDILFFNDVVLQSPVLVMPHPRLHLRKFVLKPLLDIVPHLVHPVFKKTIRSLYASCEDELSVTPFVQKPLYVCVEGNIGSGKTTLAKALAQQLNAAFVPEQFEQNALLPLFYKDAKAFGFLAEYSFLIQRFQQLHTHFLKPPAITISDYSLYKCLLFAELNLSKTDYRFYKSHFKTILNQLPAPNCVIVLETTSTNLKQNIRQRGRAYEQGIKTNYLNSVAKLYKEKLPLVTNGSVVHLKIKNYEAATLSDLLQQVQKNCSF